VDESLQSVDEGARVGPPRRLRRTAHGHTRLAVGGAPPASTRLAWDTRRVASHPGVRWVQYFYVNIIGPFFQINIDSKFYVID
jgi:hypothetical protein